MSEKQSSFELSEVETPSAEERIEVTPVEETDKEEGPPFPDSFTDTRACDRYFFHYVEQVAELKAKKRGVADDKEKVAEILGELNRTYTRFPEVALSEIKDEIEKTQSIQPQVIKAGEIDLPTERIKEAESFGTWGSPEWRDLYASDPLGWADNQIRMVNRILQEKPDNHERIAERDILYRWRNAWLIEYNSSGRTRIEPELHEAFLAIYLPTFEEAYKEADTKKRRWAKARLNQWKTEKARLSRLPWKIGEPL